MLVLPKCDRCGKYYDGYFNRALILFHKYDNKDSVHNQSNFNFNLCLDCTKDFELWVANKAIILEKDGE